MRVIRKLWMALVLVTVSFALSATPVSADPITQPSSLNPGDQYRLAFVTSTTRDATSADIADYNSFVTGVANTQPLLVGLGTSWNVIGSTFVPDGGTDARTNTATDPTPAGDNGLPIFLLNDTKLVDHYDDLWDGSIDVPFNIDENGDAVSGSIRVWTGTRPDGGTTHPNGHNRAFGSGVPHTAAVNTTGQGWITGTNLVANQLHPMYAMSGVLTVPEPSSFLLISIGAIGLIGFGRRRRKRAV
jgi:hypothetical protein